MLGGLASFPSTEVALFYPVMEYGHYTALVPSVYYGNLHAYDKLKEQHPCTLHLDPMTVTVLVNFLLSLSPFLLLELFGS